MSDMVDLKIVCLRCITVKSILRKENCTIQLLDITNFLTVNDPDKV